VIGKAQTFYDLLMVWMIGNDTRDYGRKFLTTDSPEEI
jgi:hypothetical protein